MNEYDVVVIGAGTAGIPCAIVAADSGARVLLVDKASRIGGTLHYTGGHLAAAGTRRQAEKGIDDTPADHLADIRRISRGSARDDLTALQVEHAAETVDWLASHDFRFAPETPRIIYGHEPYEIPRTYYGVDAGLSILEVFSAELARARRERHLEVWLDAAATGLRRDADGRVRSLTVFHGGRDIDIHSRAIVVATGGFAADPELFAELEGAPLVSAASPTSTGDGIHLVRAVGGALQGQGSYLPTFGGLPDPRSPGRANWADRQLLTTERPPLEIYVNRAGARWVAEDAPSIDAKERALTAIRDRTFWTVFDDAMLGRSTGKANMVIGKTPDDVRQMANHRSGVHCAGTVRELAGAAGIDPDGLAATVERFNGFVASGRDDDFGRTVLSMPLSAPPYYAIENHGITLITFVGLDIDTDFAVRDEADAPIPGLYAIGEVIGAGATCGNSFCSGMMVTPAITFGRLLGARLAKEAAASVAATG